MIPPRLIFVFVVAGLLLPVAALVLYGAGGILGALGDTACREIARTGALIVGILWIVDLVCLVLALGVKAVSEQEGP